MMHLITGGSGSGKSAYAEAQVLAAGEGKRIYIATMMPYGEDGRQRVERHRKLRAQKQFETIERYTDLAGLSLPEDAVVLVECMSNLVANEIFEPSGAKERTVDVVTEGIQVLNRQARQLIVVTNEIFADGVEYAEESQQYIRCLGEVNQRLAALADQVTEVVYGIPVKIKG